MKKRSKLNLKKILKNLVKTSKKRLTKQIVLSVRMTASKVSVYHAGIVASAWLVPPRLDWQIPNALSALKLMRKLSSCSLLDL